MEYASGGELFDYINSQSVPSSDHSGNPSGLNESEARQFFRQLVSAVQYLHEVQWCERYFLKNYKCSYFVDLM